MSIALNQSLCHATQPIAADFGQAAVGVKQGHGDIGLAIVGREPDKPIGTYAGEAIAEIECLGGGVMGHSRSEGNKKVVPEAVVLT